MVGAVFLIGFLVLTIVHQPPLERMADPTDTGYIPLPDWYFLFLYQLLKYEYAAGSFTVVGAMIMPGLAFGALLLAPFLDRGTERRPWKRPVAVGMMLLAISAAVFLTWQSVATHDWAKAEEQGKSQKKPTLTQMQKDIRFLRSRAVFLAMEITFKEGQPGLRWLTAG